MKQYQSALQRHLESYAKCRLGVFEEGTFKGRHYPHVLPSQLRFLNFLEPVRAELQAYLQENPRIKLHQYFHHLNSSQAFALNLFYPYFAARGQSARALSTALGVDAEVLNWEFEAVPDEKEGTNVDVLWRVSGEASIFCEVKLSETEFGTAKNDLRHRKKLAEIYRPRLNSLISDDLLEEQTFFDHYQLLRNVALLADSDRHRLVILIPRNNESLKPQLSKVLAGVKPKIRGRINVAYVEDSLSNLLANPSLSPELRVYARSLVEKYVPSIAG